MRIDRNLSRLSVVLKFHDASVPLDSFLCYLILYFYFFVFLEEKDTKVEQNYIFNSVFNRVGLSKSN